MNLENLDGIINTQVEHLEGELVSFLQDMIKIPTENPPGRNYRECAELIGSKMKDFGCRVEYVETPAEKLPELAPHGEGLPRVSVLGTYPGREERPLIHFTGHYDVVPAGTGWTMDPYAAVIREGKIFGRGSSDMKSGIAAQIFALEALRRAGINLNGSVVLSATPDEETGGFAGLGYLVDRGYITRENTDYCVITECLDVDSICLGHRGTLWFEIKTFGRQSHGCMPSEGINAAEKMVDLVKALKQGIEPYLQEDTKYPVFPEPSRRGSLTLTMIEAGNKINTVPGECKASFDMRLIPEQDVAWALEKIEQVCRDLEERDPDFKREVKILMKVNPTLVPEDTDLVKVFQESGKQVLEKPMRFSLSPGSDDQKFVVQRAGLDKCIVYGPGPLQIAHKSDEYISIEDLKKGTRVMALAMVKLLGKA